MMDTTNKKEYEAIKAFYEMGKGNDNELLQFFSYWIAFCLCYSQETFKVGNSDRRRIYEYCRANEALLSKLKLFEGITELTVKEVEDLSHRQYNEPMEWYYYPHRLYETINNKNVRDHDRIAALLISIYQVRCNLFHGHKTPTGIEEWRDWVLIEEACLVLEKILDNKLK